jgi:hypothetical protein
VRKLRKALTQWLRSLDFNVVEAASKGGDFDLAPKFEGHARPGGSQGLNAKFGAEFLDAFPDWFGTGEEYRLSRAVCWLDNAGFS